MHVKDTSHWQRTFHFPKLGKQEVHLWLADLTQCVIRFDNFMSFLSKEEVQRVKASRVKAVCEKFVVARGLLREALGGYLGESPKEILIQYNQNGKPFVENAINFNVTHSQDLVLFAFYQDEVGIDLQYQKALSDVHEISLRFFASCEANEILHAKEKEKIDKFYNIWVKKEAYTKVRGSNLFKELKYFKSHNLHIEKADCNFKPIFLNRQYTAMLATHSQPSQIGCWLIENGHLLAGS